MSMDVPHRPHPVKTVFLSSLPSVLVVPSVRLVTWHCHVVIVVGVVERLREVMVEEEVVDDGG